MAHVVATAFASKVFPVPGGPYRSRPERHRPSDSSSGCSRGNWIVSRISFFTSCSPPTSCQDTEGICQERENPCQCLIPEPGAHLGSSCSSIHTSPLLSFAMEKTNCTNMSPGMLHSQSAPHLQPSTAPRIICQQKYPRENICQGCMQL